MYEVLVSLLQMEQNRLLKQIYQMRLLMDEIWKNCWDTFCVELVFILYGWTRVLEILKVFYKGWLIMCSRVATDCKRPIKIWNIQIIIWILKGKIFAWHWYKIILFQGSFHSDQLNNNMYAYSENPNDRRCVNCTSLVENEHHFVYNCPLYNALRKRVMENALNIPIHRLLEGNNEKYSRLVAKLVFHAYEKKAAVHWYLNVDRDTG